MARMMRVGAIFGFLFSTAFAPLASAETLFNLGGKAWTKAELSPAEQQRIYDIEHERFEKMQGLVDDVVFNMWLNEEVKRTNSTRAKVEGDFIKVKEASDKEAKDWFDKNKERIPYPFEQIKGEIKKLLANEKIQEKRTKVVADYKKKSKFAPALSEPAAPVVQIASDGFPSMGPATAKVTIVEFADYQCPHCKMAADALKKVMGKMKDSVRLVYMDFPINPSGISLTVAHGAVCAEEQKKFWEYNAKAFDMQKTLSNESAVAIAKELKLDETAFGACMASNRPAEKVAKAKAEGERLGVTGTPAIYINGVRETHVHTAEEIEAAITKAIKGAST
jgi:protein-disulfide isomerase